MSELPTSTFCANHPQIETNLHCNRCGKPICPKCAVSTPTGYRCRECVRGQQKVFETSRWYDFISAIVLGGLLSLLGSWIIPPFSFFTILLAPIAGVIIAEAVRFAVQRRRSGRLFLATAAAVVVGSLPILLYHLVIGLAYFGEGGIGSLWNVLWQGVYTFVVTSTVYYRMAGIQIRR
jgi:hypothetical protein